MKKRTSWKRALILPVLAFINSGYAACNDVTWQQSEAAKTCKLEEIKDQYTDRRGALWCYLRASCSSDPGESAEDTGNSEITIKDSDLRTLTNQNGRLY